MKPTNIDMAILSIGGVAGVVKLESGFRVYLKKDSDTVRAEILEKLAGLGYTGPVEFEVTGPFRQL